MRYLDQARARGDRPLERGGDIADVLWGNWNLDQFERDTFAQLPLTKGGEHAAVILGSRQYLVTRLQIVTQQQRFEGLRSIPRNRSLFPAAPKQLRQARADSFRLRLKYLPHGISRRVFLLPRVAHQRFGHQARAGGYAS